MENTSRVSMAALSKAQDVCHEDRLHNHPERLDRCAKPHVVPNGAAESPDHFVERDGLRFAGTHLIVDLWHASNLDNIDVVNAALHEAAAAAGATLLKIDLHCFAPSGGITGVAVLAESHISIHTWPERAYAAVDVFMCGDADPHKAIQVLRHAFASRVMAISEHRRGVMP